MYEVSKQRKPKKTGWFLFFLILILLGLVSGFYGCQYFQPKTEPVAVNDQMPLDRRIGILKSLGGVRTSNQGTHLLQLDDGNTILLKSLELNLDDPQYLDKTVEVRGLLTYTTDNKQIMEVMNIDLVQPEAQSSQQTPNWKDYQSTGLGITLKYRDDLAVDETSGVSFKHEITQQESTQQTSATVQTNQTSPLVHFMTISVEKLNEGETLFSKLGLKKGDTAELLSNGMSKSKIGAGNYDSIKKVDGTVTDYYVQAGNNVYTIALDSGNDEQTLPDQNLFYEMLGTLNITSATGTVLPSDTTNNITGTQAVVNETPTQETVAPAVKPVIPAVNPVVKETQETKMTITEPPAPTTVTTLETQQVTQETSATGSNLAGFETLQSDSFKFSLQYPKSWYYSGTSGSESGVIRHYEFGSKPLEEVPGDVTLDLMTGTVPSGSTTTENGKTITTVVSGGSTQVYIKGSGSRIYRLTGPASKQATLLQMAGTLQD